MKGKPADRGSPGRPAVERAGVWQSSNDVLTLRLRLINCVTFHYQTECYRLWSQSPVSTTRVDGPSKQPELTRAVLMGACFH